MGSYCNCLLAFKVERIHLEVLRVTKLSSTVNEKLFITNHGFSVILTVNQTVVVLWLEDGWIAILLSNLPHWWVIL